MRNYEQELKDRVSFIRERLAAAKAKGVVFGNSGGKDSALVGILCARACENVLGVMMPCGSKQNYGRDLEDARALAAQYRIPTVTVDLTRVREELRTAIGAGLADGAAADTELSSLALANMAPRLRMAALYSIAQSRGALVAGTGNRSEVYMGYFTKWGDGAYDFNPIADLTVREIYEFLDYLQAPASIIEKAPSAGLFEGQTDEKEMGVTYAAIDAYLLEGTACPQDLAVIRRYHEGSRHKRQPAAVYGGSRSPKDEK